MWVGDDDADEVVRAEREIRYFVVVDLNDGVDGCRRPRYQPPLRELGEEPFDREPIFLRIRRDVQSFDVELRAGSNVFFVDIRNMVPDRLVIDIRTHFACGRK